jgi:hypothetical protein
VYFIVLNKEYIMVGETPGVSVEDFPDSAVGYVEFLRFELAESAGATSFQVHHAAPEDMTEAQLETLAGLLRGNGWIADVAPAGSEEDAPLGVRIRSSVA